MCELTIPKQDQIRKRIKYRNINGIGIDDFGNDLVFHECDSDDLEAVVANFKEVVSKAMNTHAPFIEKDVTIRRKLPWFNDNIKRHKRKVRSLERLFKCKRTYSTWLEFNSARKGYREALTHAKIACYSDQIKSNKGDTKKLYNLVYGLMGDVKSNPLPDHTDDAKLAEEFVDFFIAKIQAIRDDLEHHEKFKPTIRSTNSFMEFRLYNEDEIQDKIFNMKKKSCKIDQIPTNLLRKCIDHLLPVLTRLVNISLQSGVFS